MNPETVVVSGHGRLADMIAGALAAHATVRRLGSDDLAAPASGYRLLIRASDAWEVGPGPVRDRARSLATPWLAVHTELGHAIIGPMEVPGRPGCADCAEARRASARADLAGHEVVWQRHRERLAGAPSAWLTGAAAGLVAELVVAQVRSGLAGSRAAPALVKVDLDRLWVSEHRFLPDSLCSTCGQLPADEPAPLRLHPRLADPPGSFRTQRVAERLDQLADTYVDLEVGLVRSLTSWSEGGLIMASAPIRLRGGHEEGGHGRGTAYRACRVTALLEALERHAGITPGGRRTTVTASFAEIADRAVDPRTLGLYPPDRYQLPGFRCQPFSPSQPHRWVWGFSFARGEPVLVPEAYAYYGEQHPDDGPLLAYECSNGCALGGCVEEAILYGLLEVAERDAFLLTWYARLPAPPVDLGSAADPRARLVAAAIRAESGYRVDVFDISTEQGLPCVWAMATNPSPGDGRPALACAAGAHLDPTVAVRNALGELGPNLGLLLRRYPEQAARAGRMAADSRLVTEMADHSMLYADPEAAARLRFLTIGEAGSGGGRPVTEVGGPDRLQSRGEDVTHDLRSAIDRYLATGLDVVVVDQTTSEQRVGGFACVKVIVPGTLPMTFGHDYRRVDGLPRLFHAPVKLGYRDRPLAPGEVNPYPHPFP